MTRREALHGFLLGPGVAAAMVRAPAAGGQLATRPPLLRLAREIDRLRFRSMWRNLMWTRFRLRRLDAAAAAGRKVHPSKRMALGKLVDRRHEETWSLRDRWCGSEIDGWIP